MHQRRPFGPATPTVSGRPGSRRPARSVRTVLVAVLAGATLLGSAAPAAAVPPPPPNPTDSQLGTAKAEQDAAAAEVGRIRGLVAAAEAELEKAGVLAEAAGTAHLIAEERLTQAQEAAERTAADLHAAGVAVAESEARIAHFSRDSYMQGSAMSSTAHCWTPPAPVSSSSGPRCSTTSPTTSSTF
jgi:hypothetical protein